MRMSIVKLEHYFVVSLLVLRPFFFQCSAQAHQLKSITYDGFGRLEQFVVHDTLLIPPNTEYKLRAMDIRICCECWCMIGLTPWLVSLWIVVVYPLFITSNDTMQKWCKKPFRLCCWSNYLHVKKRLSKSLGFNSYVLNFLAFESFPIIFNAWKWLIELVPMILQVLLAFDMDLYRIMPPILHLQPILVLEHVFCLQHQNHHFWRVETSRGMLFHLD